MQGRGRRKRFGSCQARQVVVAIPVSSFIGIGRTVYFFVLPLPGGNISSIGWRNIIYVSPLIIIVQRHIEQFAVLCGQPALNIVFHRLVNGVRSRTIGLSRELTDSIVAVSHHGQFAAVHLSCFAQQAAAIVVGEGAVDVVGLARAGVAFALCDEVSHEIVALRGAEDAVLGVALDGLDHASLVVVVAGALVIARDRIVGQYGEFLVGQRTCGIVIAQRFTVRGRQTFDRLEIEPCRLHLRWIGVVNIFPQRYRRAQIGRFDRFDRLTDRDASL